MTIRAKIKIFIKKVYPNFFVKSNTSTLTKTRIFSGIFRTCPDFLIIGSTRCGTTSLYDYICKHSGVYPAITKQIDYFDFNYHMKNRWYRAFFPSIFKKFVIKKIFKKPFLTGEASPDYISHPHAPKRISKDLPNVKLIAILRDPVARAYSNYQHNIRKKKENLSFEDALKNEKERTELENIKLEKNEFYYSENLRRYSYIERGIYVNQIVNWLKFFPNDRLLIVSTEDLKKNPDKILTTIFSFLNLDLEHVDVTQKLNVGTYSNMTDETREYLQNVYKPSNEQLYKLIKTRFDW